jgi:DNA-binding LacI/PurR family transcriptional regulator
MAVPRIGQGRYKPRVTLHDVAKQAGVSPAAVSIVMRDVSGVSDATRARVKAAAEELGYRPDVRARSLAGQKSRFLGVMFGVGVGSFHFDLLEGLYAAAEEHGHSLVLTALTAGRDEAKAAQALQDFRFDGLIMLGPPTARPLLAGTLPVVVIGWHVDDPLVDSVRTSDEHGMSLAVEHLVSLGHRRIAHLDGGDGPIAASRRAGYELAMQAHGLAAEVSVVRGGQTQLDGQRAVRSLLEAGEPLPTALIAYNDDTAVAAMGVLAQQQVTVPERVSVVGWDDAEAAALSPVGLTSVAQHPEVLARVAVERVIDRIEQRRVDDHEVVLEPQLVVRTSTSHASGLMS